MNTVAPFKPLTKEDVAEVLGVSIRTIENWVNDGTLPAPKRLGNRVYWHPAVFFGWLETRLMEDRPTETRERSEVEWAPATVPNRQTPRSAKPSKTEVETLRSRDQTKLYALKNGMGG